MNALRTVLSKRGVVYPHFAQKRFVLLNQPHLSDETKTQDYLTNSKIILGVKRVLNKNPIKKQSAQGGTRTPMSVMTHEPESCVSTNFTT